MSQEIAERYGDKLVGIVIHKEDITDQFGNRALETVYVVCRFFDVEHGVLKIYGGIVGNESSLLMSFSDGTWQKAFAANVADQTPVVQI